MPEITDKELARRLREVIAARKLTIREVADAIGVPYRTLQNQLLGHNRMPATTYSILLAFLDVPNEFVREGRYKPRFRPLADTIKSVFGPLLPDVDENLGLLPPPNSERSPEDLDRCARAIAIHFRDAYERRLISIVELIAAEHWNDDESTDAPPGDGSNSALL